MGERRIMIRGAFEPSSSPDWEYLSLDALEMIRVRAESVDVLKSLPASFFDDRDEIPTDADWVDMVGKVRTDIDKLVNRVLAGMDPDAFASEFFDLLTSGHNAAQVMGRQRAGTLGGLTDEDRLVASIVMQEQGSYLAGFVARLRSGQRYFDDEGKIQDGAIRRDAQMYASRMRGTSNTAFEVWSPDEAEFDWVLGDAEHCPDCLDLAARSPWPKGTLSVFPGDGGTECVTECQCHLRRDDGVTGFLRDR